MPCTACLVCFISTVNDCSKKRKKKPWKPGPSSGHITNLKQTIFGLSISMMTTDNFCFYLQNRQIETSQTGGQQYNDASPWSIPWTKVIAAKFHDNKQSNKHSQIILIAILFMMFLLKWIKLSLISEEFDQQSNLWLMPQPILSHTLSLTLFFLSLPLANSLQDSLLVKSHIKDVIFLLLEHWINWFHKLNIYLILGVDTTPCQLAKCKSAKEQEKCGTTEL